MRVDPEARRPSMPPGLRPTLEVSQMKPDSSIARRVDIAGVARPLLALSSVAAGLIHAAVVPEHLGEARAAGSIFVLAAALQIAWAIQVLLRPSAGLYRTGAVANGAMIGIWILSRTIGLPIGPEPWMAEPAGTLDVAATTLELLLVAGSLSFVHLSDDGVATTGRSDRRPVSPRPTRTSSRPACVRTSRRTGTARPPRRSRRSSARTGRPDAGRTTGVRAH